MNFKNIIFPRLYCPFPELVSPFAEAVHEHTLDWASRHRLVTDDKAFARLRSSKFGWLAARAYPNAPLDRLKIVSDWNTWLFILDDQCDECGLGRRPAELSAVHTRCLEMLCGKHPEAGDLPLVRALHDIFSRLEPLASQAWLARFAKSAAEYFEATLWEAQNRFHKQWPDRASYVRMRPYTGGLYTDIELIEITEQISLPCLVRTHSRVNQLVAITNDVVCWCNDIISLQKEKAHGDMHNLVLIMHNESGLGLQESVNHAKRLIENRIRRFQLFENQLPSFGGQIDREVARFVAVLRSWMRGNLDWSYESGRYNTLPVTKRIARTGTNGKPAKKAWPIAVPRFEISTEADLLAE
ncbi:MAG: hypothetical protein L0Y39_07925 [Methylococcaceae bacterium]|nr:hypothetical protein [Methylococcaceae bacterium]